MMQSDELPLPVYDLSKFLRYKPGGPTDWVTHCDAIAKSLEKLGVVLVKDRLGVVLVKDRRLTRPYLQALHSAETLLADNLGSHTKQVCTSRIDDDDDDDDDDND
jgi:hypothetical protein